MKTQETQAPPSHASWESTLKCPLRCKHCGLNAGTSRPGELSTEEAKKMLSALSAFGVKNLIISGGEFTIRPDWLEILNFSLPLFKSVRMITCGWLGKNLFGELAKIKNTSNLIISVSLDGLEKNHDLRRGQGSFAKVLETLEYSSPIPRTVLTTVDNLNITDCPDILGLCLKLNIPLWSIQISLPAGRMKPGLFLGKAKIQLLAGEILHWQKKFGAQIEISPDDCFANLFPQRNWGEWTGCHAGKNLITVLNDGLITACPTMGNITAGNILTESLEKIWNSDIMKNFRREQPKECLACGQCAGGCKTVSKLFNEQFCSIN